MSNLAPQGPRFGPLLATGLAATLLWLLYGFSLSNPMLGQEPERGVIRGAALVATALLIVLGAGFLMLEVIRPARGAARPTGLERSIVYAVLVFAASCATLWIFGVDIGALLATSAIMGLAIGLAVQPTLSSLISGLTLRLDGTLRVGDGVCQGGEIICVESFTWRNVRGRKANGRWVVLPNATLSNGNLEVVSHDRPVGAEMHFNAPSAVPPQHIAELVTDLIADLPQLDASQPIQVAPTEYEARGDRTRYKVRYWLRRYGDADAAEGEVLQRLWYGFQRHRIQLLQDQPGTWLHPLAAEPSDLTFLVESALQNSTSPHLTQLPESAAAALAAGGEILLFAPGERVILPRRMEGWSFLLLRGEVTLASDIALSGEQADGHSIPKLQVAGRAAAIQYIAHELAQRIGPYAELAVRRAARKGSDTDSLLQAAALEIPDEEERTRFLHGIRLIDLQAWKSGLFLQPGDGMGQFALEWRLQARGEITLLAMHPTLLREAAMPGSQPDGAPS